MMSQKDHLHFLRRTARGLAFFLALGLFAVTSACVTKEDTSPYPAPGYRSQAETNRRDFLQAYLAGQWCKAGQMYHSALDGYYATDDFCAAAETIFTAWKLKSYSGLDDPKLLQAARLTAQTGTDCPRIKRLLEQPQVPTQAQEDELLKLVVSSQWERLYARLKNQEDQLLNSVYCRKAARAAILADNETWARRFLTMARELDGRQGWIVFLIQDWSLTASLEKDPLQKTHIQRRLETLANLIEPCEDSFQVQ